MSDDTNDNTPSPDANAAPAPAAPAAPPAPPAAPQAPAVPAITQQYFSADPLADLERIIAARGDAQASVQRPQRMMSYNTASDEVRVNGALVDVSAQNGSEGVTSDTNVDLQATQAAALAKYNALADSLDEITGYDVNGQPLYKISDPAERERIAREVQTMHTALTYQAHRYNEIEKLREARAAEEVRKQREAYAIAAWSGGNRERAQMLQEEIAREEARAIAANIVASRAGRL